MTDANDSPESAENWKITVFGPRKQIEAALIAH